MFITLTFLYSFSMIQQELALPQEKINALNQLPENKKWLMLQQQMLQHQQVHF